MAKQAVQTLQSLPMLLSVSVLNGSPNQGDDDTPITGGGRVHVKNTFIDVDEDTDYEVIPRRASSAPPPRRHVESDDEDLGSEEVQIQSVASKQEHCPLDSPRAASSGGSTTSHGATQLYEESEENSDTLSVTSGSEKQRGILSLDELIPERERARLTSNAKVFVPSRSLSTSPTRARPCSMQSSSAPVMPQDARRAFAEVIAAGLAALKSFSVTEVREHAGGWQLMGRILPFSNFDRPRAFSLVQASLLRGAEKSDSVYIVGYEAEPFVMLPDEKSFSATLAIVPDESSACWDLLAGGCCKRGSACRWWHPVWKVDVQVVLEEPR